MKAFCRIHIKIIMIIVWPAINICEFESAIEENKNKDERLNRKRKKKGKKAALDKFYYYYYYFVFVYYYFLLYFSFRRL